MKALKAVFEFDDGSELILDFNANSVLASYPISLDDNDRKNKEKELDCKVSEILRGLYGI